MMEVFSRRKVQRYLAYFFAWTVFGFFNFSRDLTRRLYWHEATHWQETLVSWMVGVYITAALTPVVLWLGRRWPIERQTWRTRVPLHLALSAAFSAVELALETVAFIQLRLVESVTKHSFLVGFPVLLVTGFHENIITYWGILGIQSGFRYYRGFREREMHASELKAQLVKAQLSALKMQLQPHFLFNTLNAIMVLVRQQRGRQAEEMLARLSDLLRCVLEDVEAQQIPLRRELEYLRLYLSIEQVRFQDRLGIEITADDTALDAAVPHMGLQPIVENAVRHGIGRVAAAGIIRISALRTGADADHPGGGRRAGAWRRRSRRRPRNRPRKYTGASPPALRRCGKPQVGKRRTRRGRHHDHALSRRRRNSGNRTPCL